MFSIIDNIIELLHLKNETFFYAIRIHLCLVDVLLILNFGIMKVINLDFVRSKLIECKINSIDEKINKLHELNLFFQRRFDEIKSEQINNKIEYLHKRKEELMAAF